MTLKPKSITFLFQDQQISIEIEEGDNQRKIKQKIYHKFPMLRNKIDQVYRQLINELNKKPKYTVKRKQIQQELNKIEDGNNKFLQTFRKEKNQFTIKTETTQVKQNHNQQRQNNFSTSKRYSKDILTACENIMRKSKRKEMKQMAKDFLIKQGALKQQPSKQFQRTKKTIKTQVSQKNHKDLHHQTRAFSLKTQEPSISKLRQANHSSSSKSNKYIYLCDYSKQLHRQQYYTNPVRSVQKTKKYTYL